MKLLFLATSFENWIYDTLFQEQKAIADEIDGAVFYGPGYKYNTNYVPDIIKEVYGDGSPDFIFSYISAHRLVGEPLGESEIKQFNIPKHLHQFPIGLDEVNIKKILWINDFWKCSKQTWDSIILGLGFDYVIATYNLPFVRQDAFFRFFSSKVRKRAVFIPWPRSMNGDLFFPHRDTPKEFDLTILGAMEEKMYPFRVFMNHKLQKQTEFSYFTQDHPGYKYFTENTDILFGDNYRKALNRTRIFLSCTSRFKIPFIKIYEVLASNTLLMCDKPKGADQIYLKDGYNCVFVNKRNLIKKIRYYIKNEDKRLEIIKNANDTFEKYHSTVIRAKQLNEILCGINKNNKYSMISPQLANGKITTGLYRKNRVYELILILKYFFWRLIRKR
ncbi:MAG: hypothetical protein A2Y40_05295 [Candidatus Margulisbacteria bacterium GWF2_35_9]|nr:MAG: hypothetical protein A2Y40_05295 [Candidatus Margulisbacteria bacterium GWF2_35_9]